MPNHRATERWEHPTYKYAYVREFRGAACTVIHGGSPLSTGLKWAQGSRTRAMAILEDRLNAYLRGPRSPYTSETLTCVDVLDRFLSVKADSIASRTKRHYIEAFKKYIPETADATDTNAIRKYIRAASEADDMAASTRAMLLGKCRTVFAFAVDEGICPVNPIAKTLIPAFSYGDADPYTRKEFNAIVRHIKSDKAKAMFLFLGATGCRIVEALRLTWESVHDDHVVIDGKRRNHAKPVYRIIPFDLVPEAKTALGALKRGKGRIFTYSTSGYALELWKQACEKAKKEPKGLHSIRKMVVNERLREGWSERLMDAILGHTETISKKHYRTPYTVDDLNAMAPKVQDSRKIQEPTKAKAGTTKPRKH